MNASSFSKAISLTAIALCASLAVAEDPTQSPAPKKSDEACPSQEWKRGRHFIHSDEIMKLVESYKAAPSDELKAKIKEKLSAALDEYVKMKEEKLSFMAKRLEAEKQEVEKIKANKDAELELRLENILSGKDVKGDKSKRSSGQQPSQEPVN